MYIYIAVKRSYPQTIETLQFWQNNPFQEKSRGTVKPLHFKGPVSQDFPLMAIAWFNPTWAPKCYDRFHSGSHICIVWCY